MRTELDVVNSCLASMGQAPLTSLSRANRVVTLALDYLRKMNRRLQVRSWWFNTFTREVTPDPVTYRVDGQLPENLLSLRAAPVHPAVTLRAPGVLYTSDDKPVTYPIFVTCVVELPFLDLPPVAQDVVEERTVRAFSARIAGNSPTEQDQDTLDTLTALNAEHIRNSRVNILNRPETAQKMLYARGTRPYLRYRS
jgi:hypothetical protein